MSSAQQTKEFYERYVEEHVPYHRSPRGLKRLALSLLPYWSYREWRFWERFVPRGSRLLDLGCARGREVFRERAAFVVGLDAARNALADCVPRYDGAIEGSLAALPAADASFDCVVSSHVLGHMPAEAKDRVLREIYRVLRPGGLSLHVVETDSNGWLMEQAKEAPELYRRYLVDQDGHVGLELASEAVARFERAGLAVEAVAVLGDSDVHPRLALKWFGGEYQQTSQKLAKLVARSEAILGNPLRLAWEEIRLGRRGLRPAGTELDQALFVSIVTRKPPAPR
jgi:SAM-dependent methyltransferase